MRILAASSGGGHWIELLRIVEAFAEHDLHFVTVQPEYRRDVGNAGFHTVRDATQWSPAGLAILVIQMLFVVLRVRPQLVVTTGAAPGYFALRLGRLMGARTIWVDSLANVDELSRAGRMAGKHADLWLTQWPELATPDGPEYAGRVL